MLGACTGTPVSQYFEAPYFDTPPAQITRADRELFERALFRQKNNRIQAAIKVWNQFLLKQPRSFEAHNNLGLVYFENDQMEPAIAEFETARSLEPTDVKIKKNLIRVLKFKATLLKEAKDYNGAVDYLMRAQDISEPREKEQIGFLIEEMEDKVFQQAKSIDTLEAYEDFLKRYPNSPKNSDEARNKIEGMKPRDTQMAAPAEGGDAADDGPAMEKMEKETLAGENPILENLTMEEEGQAMEKGGSMMQGETMEKEIKESTDLEDSLMPNRPKGKMAKDPANGESKLMKGTNGEFIPQQPREVIRRNPQEIEIATQPDPKPSTSTSLFPKTSSDAVLSGVNPGLATPGLGKRVRIETRQDPLRVREGPFPGSRVISSIDKGTLVPLIQEQDGWYKVEFARGQAGWISKKFAQVVE